MGWNSEEHPSCQAPVKTPGQVRFLCIRHVLSVCFPLSCPRRKLAFRLLMLLLPMPLLLKGACTAWCSAQHFGIGPSCCYW